MRASSPVAHCHVGQWCTKWSPAATNSSGVKTPVSRNFDSYSRLENNNMEIGLCIMDIVYNWLTTATTSHTYTHTHEQWQRNARTAFDVRMLINENCKFKFIRKFWPWALALNTRPHRVLFLLPNWKHFACSKTESSYALIEISVCVLNYTRRARRARLNQSCLSIYSVFCFLFFTQSQSCLRRYRLPNVNQFHNFWQIAKHIERCDRCFEMWMRSLCADSECVQSIARFRLNYSQNFVPAREGATIWIGRETIVIDEDMFRKCRHSWIVFGWVNILYVFVSVLTRNWLIQISGSECISTQCTRSSQIFNNLQIQSVSIVHVLPCIVFCASIGIRKTRTEYRKISNCKRNCNFISKNSLHFKEINEIHMKPIFHEKIVNFPKIILIQF